MSLPLDDVTLLNLHCIEDLARGTLCVAEYDKHIPFEMKRVFYLYDMPIGTIRGQHAHRKQDQFLICLSGSIELTTVRKHKKQRFILSCASEGLYFPPMTWISIEILKAHTICSVISSGSYDESDYIRNYSFFEKLLNTPEECS